MMLLIEAVRAICGLLTLLVVAAFTAIMIQVLTGYPVCREAADIIVRVVVSLKGGTL